MLKILKFKGLKNTPPGTYRVKRAINLVLVNTSSFYSEKITIICDINYLISNKILSNCLNVPSHD